MKAPTKNLGSAVNSCLCCTYELHSEGMCLETMPFSTRVIRGESDMAAVLSPLRMPFSCDFHPSKVTQVLDRERVANGINPWA